jgi:hypothetical protein
MSLYYSILNRSCSSVANQRQSVKHETPTMLSLCLEQTQHSHADGYSERNLVWLS